MKPLTSQDPARIGPYRLIARLGEGGMGLVYLGRSDAGRTVAVKVVQAEYAGNQEFRRRFAREVTAARRVGGEWTAEVLDADPEAEVPWVATRYVPGPDLSTVVGKDYGPLPEHSVLVLANRLALALRAVHEAGLIHRDLKPSNVLVTVDGPRVIDFGIARAMDSLAGDSLHTRTGMLIGSPGFMSPEQVRGRELTPASDVFCLGAVLVHAATGRLLFGAADTGLPAHLFKIAEDEPDLTGVPASLLGLVRACLAKDPAARPTPQEIADRTAQESPEEWLPGAVLAQLGRHAAGLLDFAPEQPADTPAPQPVPLVKDAAPQRVPSPPAHAPTVPAPFGAPQGFGPPTPPAHWTGFPAPAPDGDAAPPHPHRWWGLVVITLAQLLVLFDLMSFNLAAPAVQADLGMRTDGLSPLYLAYTLAFGGLLIMGGHLADRIGRRRTFVIGLVGCVLASGLGGLTGGEGPLILARFLQGACAALLTPSALALVTSGFTDTRERHRALGVYAATAAGGSAVGVLAGGWIIESANWRVCLFAAALLAVVTLIAAVPLVHERPEPPKPPLDTGGILLGTAALAALGYGLAQADAHGWTDPLILAALTSGVLLLVAYLVWQAGRTDTFPEASPATGLDRAGSFLTLALAGCGTMAALSACDYYLLGVVGFSPATAGAAFLPLAAGAVVGATQVAARLMPRVAPRVLIIGGLLATALGLVLMTRLDSGGAYADVLPGLVLVGFGGGLALMPLLATATAAGGPGRSGVRAGTVTAGQNLGSVLGSALTAAVLAAEIGRVTSPDGVTTAVLRAYTTGLWWAVGALLLACLTAGLMIGAPAARPAGQAPGR
ncbi:MFS transporter [Streptomyces sp. NPDC057682]|uniref:MDR family MFS transporter n=1 Tax=Streptomyces sp. NPDC057682 TaxID=3346210 RepID=UPI0036BBC0E8